MKLTFKEACEAVADLFEEDEMKCALAKRGMNFSVGSMVRVAVVRNGKPEWHTAKVLGFVDAKAAIHVLREAAK